MPEFQAFPKMARLTRECIVTEKLDGTNAQIFIADKEVLGPDYDVRLAVAHKDVAGSMVMFVGSRTRWITPQSDNFGFAGWCQRNADELFKLGYGRHFGEWWGSGIQRGYGLKGGDKRFSLFNVTTWTDDVRPACCSVVPILFRGMFHPGLGDDMIAKLAANGSFAAPGFMDPEGIVIYHVAAGVGFKKTIKGDEKPKGQQE